MAKNIGIGCLIAIAIVLLFGLSCTRACFGFRHRHSYLHQLRRRASNNDPNAYGPVIFTSGRLRLAPVVGIGLAAWKLARPSH